MAARAHLRFPVYFGWNWNALWDCLTDMSWAPADHYLLVIERSGLMLAGCPEDREAFLTLLEAHLGPVHSSAEVGARGLVYTWWRSLLLVTDDWATIPHLGTGD